MSGPKAYDHPTYTVLREKHITSAGMSVPATDSGYVGATLRTRDKAVVLGCAFRVGSGGSAAGTNSFAIKRRDAGGTLSTWQAQTAAMSAGASAANDIIDISLASAMTLESMGQAAVLTGNAASLDKAAVLTDVIWRHRFLPI